MRRDPLLLLILSALATGCGRNLEDTEMCLSLDDVEASCPAADDVVLDDLFHTSDCDLVAVEVLGEGTQQSNPLEPDSGLGDICCYPVTARDPNPRSECMVGRPYLEGGAPTLAATQPGEAWSGPAAPGPRDAALAAAWLEMARMEHASVAAFAKLTLQLMAAGAPPELLAEVQQAALDEVRHAQDCFAQAARFSGQAVSPGPLPLGPVAVSGDLVQLAVEAAREGCLGETLGAWLAARMAERARDPRSKAVLVGISEDEARHAALSWRVVAWAIRVGGAPVRAAVAEALAAPFPVGLPLQVPGAEAHGAGVVGEAELTQAVEAVLRPAAAALLAA